MPVMPKKKQNLFTPFWSVGYKSSNRQFESPNNLTKLERELFDLVKKGNVKGLIDFLCKNKPNKKMNINIEDSTTNETALLIAVRLKHDECIKVLIMNGAVTDSLNSKHTDAVREAIYLGNLSTVETIFAFIPDINRRQIVSGNSYLHLAAGCKNYEVFNFISAKCGSNMIRIKNSMRETPYDIAIRSFFEGTDKSQLIKVLIKFVLEDVEECVKALAINKNIIDKIYEDVLRIIAQFVADDYSNELNVPGLLKMISPKCVI